MNDEENTNRKPVNTREWYDFVGQLADAIPGMHMGGQESTQKLVDMCHLEATSRCTTRSVSHL